MTQRCDPNGQFVVWDNYGYEGWKPKSYDSLKEALSEPRYQSEFVITKSINFDVVEIIGDGASANGNIILDVPMGGES